MTWHDIAWAAPLAFVVGVIVGFLLANRYRVVRRNGQGKGEG